MDSGKRSSKYFDRISKVNCREEFLDLHSNRLVIELFSKIIKDHMGILHVISLSFSFSNKAPQFVFRFYRREM